MKKISLFLSMAALVAVGMFTMGCNKLEDNQPNEEDTFVTQTITINLDESSQTRSLTPAGVKTFAEGDRIAVVFQQNWKSLARKVVSEPLEDSNITNEGKSATFTVTYSSDTSYQPKSNGTVRLIYPAAMIKSDFQTGDAIDDNHTINYAALATQDGTLAALASNLDLATYDGTMDGTSLPANATLTNRLTICAYTLKNSDGSSEITGNTIGMVIDDGTNSYYVKRQAAAGPIYVAMRPMDNADIKITTTSGANIYTKSLTGKTYEAGNGYSLSLRMTQETGVRGGFFSVSGNKVVIFSKGNLQANYNTASESWTWNFAEHQWDFIGNGGGNKLISTTSIESTEPYAKLSSNGTVDMFGFSTASTFFGIAKSSDNSVYSGDFVDWGGMDIDGNGTDFWRTMTCDNSSSYEWHYVLMDRSTVATVNSTSNARFTLANVNGVNGLIIFPDGYSGPTDNVTGITWGTKINSNKDVTGWGGTTVTSDGWAILESAGCVFLPAAGMRSGNSVSLSDSIYASKTKKGDSLYYPMQFASSSGWNVYWNMGNSKYKGASVRLVHDIN